MSKRKIACKVCDYRRPKCDVGRKIHDKMTNRLTKNGLKMDDEHQELWEQWITHTHNPNDRLI